MNKYTPSKTGGLPMMNYIKPLIIIIAVSFIALETVQTIKADYYFPMQAGTINHPHDTITRIKDKLKTNPDDAQTTVEIDHLINKLRKAISYQPSFSDYYDQLAQLMALRKTSNPGPQTSGPSSGDNNQQQADHHTQSAISKRLAKYAINLNPAAAKHHLGLYFLTKDIGTIYIATRLSPLRIRALWNEKFFNKP